MGIFLSQPNLEKYSLEGSSSTLKIDCAAVSMQGWRNNQEDSEILQIPLDEENSALFAVFDGHGSDIVSNFCARYYPELLTANSSYKNGNYEQALVESFYKMDEVMQTKVGRRVLFRNIINKEESKK